MSELYHAAKPDGSKIGPYDVETLTKMLQSGQLPSNSLVWTEGMADWKPITSVITLPAMEPIASWNPINAFTTVYFKRYATFTGRASRSEYWWSTLGYFGIIFLITVLFFLCIGITTVTISPHTPDATANTLPDATANALTIGGIVMLLLLLALLAAGFIPTLAVTVRRLHDAGFSGWYYLLNFIPYVGGLILFVFCVLPSAPPNEYGVSPDGPEN